MRRANGTGTVVKLSGNRRRPYAVRISERDKYGQITQKAIGYYATSREAQAALDEHNRLRSLGLAPAISQMDMTVMQVYDAWSARAYQKMGISAVRGYKAAWTMRISRFAGKKLRDMTIDDWQSLLDEDAEKGMSSSTLKKDVTVIRNLYRYGMKRDIVAKDLSAFLEIPIVPPKVEKGSFSDLQLLQLEEMAKNGFPWADTVLMLCYTGFRISEFLALTRFSYHPDAGGYLQGGLKTCAGKNRIVPIHPRIRTYLDAWLTQGGDTIITRNGKPVDSGWYRAKAFKPIVAKIGVPIATPHWCRHTFATLLHRAGVDETTRKWLMGHSTDQDITAHYTHETIDTLVQGIRKLS